MIDHCFVDNTLHDLREAESCPFTPSTQHHVVAACNLCVCMCGVWCVECVKCVECVEYVVCGVCGCACVFVSVSICVIVLNVEN